MINDPDVNALIIDSHESFGNWLETNRPKLIGILNQKTSQELRSKVDSEDILQESASRAVVSLPSSPLSQAEVMPWFLQIINHTIIDLYRHHFGAQKRDRAREISANATPGTGSDQTGQLADLLVASITSPSQAFSQHVRLSRMKEALSHLTPEAQKAIHWRFMEGLSSQDIAARLNKSDGAVRVLLTRTLKKLEDLLSDVRPSNP